MIADAASMTSTVLISVAAFCNMAFCTGLRIGLHVNLYAQDQTGRLHDDLSGAAATLLTDAYHDAVGVKALQVLHGRQHYYLQWL